MIDGVLTDAISEHVRKDIAAQDSANRAAGPPPAAEVDQHAVIDELRGRLGDELTTAINAARRAQRTFAESGVEFRIQKMPERECYRVSELVGHDWEVRGVYNSRGEAEDAIEDLLKDALLGGVCDLDEILEKFANGRSKGRQR
ncbi:hypothetical protein [Mycobacteroides abscessus]|nr:hypothetical protein [Mycobacteroides abscessus]SKL79438.1 Uncharacterised protein [Mycobacteroides abscessus subsp. massiliense]SHY28342.1 Uncharacterised protein [Mycobacteroides abscessus subsp. abscessus]SID71747.1 Uncharacterised protein [Mycobacteroides abscessus subsp. abscessus]SIK18849.1 Uncharacterised protein [Mycobacteroides abscessus subsp. abscessus]SIM43252.1 Uncharacterised protein [Mycobacteroides abscessus subsp. abscessus]